VYASDHEPYARRLRAARDSWPGGTCTIRSSWPAPIW
jgi:hypothetical protein